MLPASAVPVISGVVSLVIDGDSEVGASGVTVSTDKVKLLLSSDPSAFSFPAELENFDEATLITPLVVLSAVGVNVAV